MTRSHLVTAAVGALIVALVYALHSAGSLARLEASSDEARARLLAREVPSDIVIVAIDPHSLRELDEWPWPRRHYARLLQHLRRQPPRTLFFDIDFSSPSNPTDDELLERGLREWPGAPVLLAAHVQPLTVAGGSLAPTLPLPRFAEHAELVSVVLEPEADGLVRAMPGQWPIGGRELRSVVVHGEELAKIRGDVPIDFSILPSSFGYVSFSDLLNAEVDFAALAGKDVYVGATAMELRDIVSVPVHRALPGVVVQALAAESARAGVIRSPGAAAYAALLVLWTAAWVAALNGRSWRRNAAMLVAALPLLWLAALYLYSAERVSLPVVPFGLTAALGFLVATLRSLDSATWRAFAYSIGLERRGALLRSIFESSSDCILCVDAHGTIRAANPATSQLLGCGLDTVQGAKLQSFVPALAGARLDEHTGKVTEHTAVSFAGRQFPVEVGISRAGSDGGPLFTAIVRDITEREAQRRALEHQATHDALTGLPNRLALNLYLDNAVSKAPARRRIALLMLDLCRFKEVNDTLGHDVGDAVLREVGQRFAATLTERAFVSRVGGDEFTVVLPEIIGTQAIDQISQQLAEALQAPIHVQGVAIEVGLSIGIALWPDHARDTQELLRRADVAMYAAKRRGSSYEYYASELDRHTVRQLSMISELRSALANGGIELYYQPQVDLRTGQAESVEALVRWEHPMLGSVSPAEFVPLAESTDLIQPLTEWCIGRALADAAEWQAAGTPLRVAVNLSARVLQDTTFALRLAQTLAARRFDPALLELEITESAMLVDPERAKRVVLDLHALGIHIAIDDYGTGFSSLGYLRDLRADTLKLDRSFVTDLEVREDNRVIVQSTVDMAHALGLSVVAEGVETEWQQQYLAEAGYDSGQGFLFARPMTSRDCLAWVRRWNAPPDRRTAAS